VATLWLLLDTQISVYKVYTKEYNGIVLFEWDEIKNETNFRKHGIWFEEAQTTWADKHSVEFFDPEHSSDEDRFLRIGISSKSRVLLVVFCERDENQIRIISARKATQKEREKYEEGI
jgi:uncharacterized DUF497 family protein